MKKILVIGDSHCLIWDYIQKQNIFSECEFNVKHVDGATSQGVNNPNSKTCALTKFKEIISLYSSSDYIMISLGEVDCGFAIWYYADHYNVSIEEQLNRSLKSYEDFLLSEVIPVFGNRVILMGSVLPTIEDQTDKRLLVGARSKVETGIVERTSLTIRYNLELEKISASLNLFYIDITRNIYDTVSKKILPLYKHKNPYNHHLDNERSSNLWIQKLTQLKLK